MSTVGRELEDVIGDLSRLLVKERGRNLRIEQARRWTRAWLHAQGLHKPDGTIRDLISAHRPPAAQQRSS